MQWAFDKSKLEVRMHFRDKKEMTQFLREFADFIEPRTPFYVIKKKEDDSE